MRAAKLFVGLVVSSLLQLTSSTLLIDFDSARTSQPGTPLSSAIVTNVPEDPLPDRFILCYSSKQAKIDRKSPFVLYGEDSKPWLAFSQWWSVDEVVLWAEVQWGNWGEFSHAGRPWTHGWMHVCADVDTSTGDLAVSLNGGPAITRSLKMLRSNKPRNLTGKLVIGLTNSSSALVTNDQFHGSVTSINLFLHNQTRSVSEMSKYQSCEGDYMDWADISLDTRGTGVAIRNSTLIQSEDNTYKLTLPVDIVWPEAVHFCQVLGKMAEISSQEDLNITADYVKKTKSSCSQVWLPISDKDEEGEYRNTNDGSRETFLPWAEGEPNGWKLHNNVVLMTGSQKYSDTFRGYRQCALCTLEITKTMTLRGACKGSYFGNINIFE